MSTVVDKTTGLTLKTIDATGRHALTTYDVAGRPVTETGLTGKTTTTEYGGNVTRVTDSMGVTVSEYVDVLGQVVKTTANITVNDNGGLVPVAGVERTVETRVYEQNSSKVTTTDERGLQTVTVTDVFGRPLRVTGPTGVTQVNVYDDVAHTVRTGQTTGSDLTDVRMVTETRMDDSNRVVSETGEREDTVGVPESMTTFDGLGRIRIQVVGDMSTTMVLNPDGTPKTTTMTPVNPDVFPGEQVTADREHDLMGVSTKKTLTNTDGQTRPGIARVLDAAGQTVSETDQAGQTTVYVYTVDGLVAETRNQATGVVIRNTYDPVTRAVTGTETVAADGSVSRTGFEYDPVTGAMTAVFDPTDREGTQIRYVYDLYGNTTQVTYPDGKTIQHEFDEFGRQTTSTDVTGNVTTNGYDRVGLLTRVTQTSPNGEVLSEVGYEYDEYGRLTTLSRGNTVTTKYTFTSVDQIMTETTKNGDTVILDAAYEYDTHGNLTKRVDTRQDGATLGEETPGLSGEGISGQEPWGGGTLGLVTETTVYTYNAYNQLTTSAVHPSAATSTEPTMRTQYEIGVTGEVIKETVTQGGTVTVREFETNSQGHTTAIITNGVRVEQTYDLAGNLTQGVDGTVYTYDTHNQPLTETRPDGSTTQHTYWVTGQRHTTTTSSSTSSSAGNEGSRVGVADTTSSDTVGMYWDGTILVNDTHTTSNNPASTQTVSYLIGATRHTRTLTSTATMPGNETTATNTHTGVGAVTDYYVTDRHGNTTATTDTTCEVTAAYTYTDYGVPTEHTAPEQPSTGANRNPFQYASEYTTETGNQYLQARTYNPNTMSFTTKDVAEQFNVYAYANSNPITLVDPTGQTPNWDTIINGVMIGITVIGAAISAGVLAMAVGVSWLAVGVSVAAIAADLTSSGIAAAQLINTHVDGVDFISDETSEILTWAGLGLGLAAGIGAGAALGGVVKTTINTAKRTAEAAEAAEAADFVRSGVLRDAHATMNKIKNMTEEDFSTAAVGLLIEQQRLDARKAMMSVLSPPKLASHADTQKLINLREELLDLANKSYASIKKNNDLVTKNDQAWEHLKTATREQQSSVLDPLAAEIDEGFIFRFNNNKLEQQARGQALEIVNRYKGTFADEWRTVLEAW